MSNFKNENKEEEEEEEKKKLEVFNFLQIVVSPKPNFLRLQNYCPPKLSKKRKKKKKGQFVDGCAFKK